MGTKRSSDKGSHAKRQTAPQGHGKTKDRLASGDSQRSVKLSLERPLFEDSDSDDSSVLEDSDDPTSSEGEIDIEEEMSDENGLNEPDSDNKQSDESGQEELDEGDSIEDILATGNDAEVEENADQEAKDDTVTVSFDVGKQEDFHPIAGGRVSSLVTKIKQRRNLDKHEARIKANHKRTASPQSSSSAAAPSSGKGQDKQTISENDEDEYAVDSSDEEDLRNTIGNVPIEWYDNYPHIGYDVGGKRVLKPVREDQLDYFLKRMDDPTFWRTVKDRMTGQNVVLSDADIDLISRLQKGQNPDPTMEMYPKFEDLYSHEVMIHPLRATPEAKRSFIPSLHEKRLVGRMVHLIKSGIYAKCWKPKPKDEGPRYYNIWKDEEDPALVRRLRSFIPAPKLKLPGHEESYNPPEEYLFTPEEEAEWHNQDPEERRLNFIPRKFTSLRQVPGYANFVQERFERCLDLYLCPRQRKMRMNVNPEDLIPQLPKPKDLHPFPAQCAIVYRGHTAPVRSVSMGPLGQFFASGSDDCTVRVWETLTGRCLRTIVLESSVRCVQWCPNKAISLLAVAAGPFIYFINPGVGDKVIMSNTDAILDALPEATEENSSSNWSLVDDQTLRSQGQRLKVAHHQDVAQVSWHAKGDYIAVVYGSASTTALIIHQLSLRRSQNPFSKFGSVISRVLFHPTRPHLFVATQTVIRVYNLVKQELQKKLLTNCKYVSSIAVHPKGDNVIAGSYEARLSWFDMDLSTKPYKAMKYHKGAIRAVTFHRKYPLFASASDDGSVIVSHGMVYNDFMQNPLIVPVKVLRGHNQHDNLGVLDCTFHPTQPWLISAGADSTLRLFT
ncbi:ribosome biogenesis protein bop1-A-like [Varroa destructor]|uniref:Ribosome biogenesis protein BOP1 homolog n=1 Tax=Varroa destructor TaxID=109461 RepID=A0A7M7L0U9_VARDE|nr:ribosome biogenesis protein bop1-A-like [Varroa destructor]